MKKINVAKIVWISGVFLTLIAILYVVVVYKVKYESQSNTDYLYFYNCSATAGKKELCTTINKNFIANDELIYSKYKCPKKICPTMDRSVGLNMVVLSQKNKDTKILYDYINERLLLDNYKDYYPLYNNSELTNIIFISKDNKFGLLNTSIDVVLKPEYESLGQIVGNEVKYYNYESDYIVASKNKKYGAIKLSDYKNKIEFKYDSLEELLGNNTNIK